MKIKGIKHGATALFVSIMLATAIPALAAPSPEDQTTIKDVKRETSDLIQSIKSYSADQRDETIQEIEIAIMKVDNRIEALEVRVDKDFDAMTRRAREEARASLKATAQTTGRTGRIVRQSEVQLR